MREAPVMGKLRLTSAFAVSVISVSVLAAGDGSAATAPAGIYTSAQAAAGAKAYGVYCLSCHGAKLQGVTGPALRGDQSPITGIRTAGYVYGFVKSQMPLNKPGSLSPATYTAIVAYIVQQNGHPAGPHALTPSAAAKSTAKI